MIVLAVALVALREKRSTTVTADGSTTTRGANSASLSRSAPRPTPSTSRSRSTSQSGSSSTPSTAGPPSGAALKTVPLVVLNNTQTPNLARDAAQRFQSGGWTITSTGNITNDIISTCAYYDPNVSDAKAAAKALRRQFPTIKRVEPRFAELPVGPIVVVLTPDYSSS